MCVCVEGVGGCVERVCGELRNGMSECACVGVCVEWVGVYVESVWRVA